MDQLRKPFPFKYFWYANVLLAAIALILIAPIAILPLPMFRALFDAFLKIVQSGGNSAS